MTINKDFSRSLKILLIFVVALSIIVLVRKCVDVKEPSFAIKKTSYIYQKPIDLNLTELRARKRLYYENIFNKTFKSE